MPCTLPLAGAKRLARSGLPLQRASRGAGPHYNTPPAERAHTTTHLPGTNSISHTHSTLCVHPKMHNAQSMQLQRLTSS